MKNNTKTNTSYEDNNKLNIGILADSKQLSFFNYKIIEDLIKSKKCNQPVLITGYPKRKKRKIYLSVKIKIQ